MIVDHASITFVVGHSNSLVEKFITLVVSDRHYESAFVHDRLLDKTARIERGQNGFASLNHTEEAFLVVKVFVETRLIQRIVLIK